MSITKENSKKKPFYGWIIVLAGFIILAASMGIVFNCTSLFIKPMSEDLGYTRQQINNMLTVRSASIMLVSLSLGQIFKRFNIRKLMNASAIVLFLSYLAFSRVTSLSQIYILSFLTSVSLSLIGVMPLSVIINNWFEKDSGLAIGLAFTGSGVGGMIFTALAGRWIVAYGWRTTYVILALIMFAIVAPFVFFVIKLHPKDMGLKPYGHREEELAKRTEDLGNGVMFSDAIRTPKLWIVSASLVVTVIGANILMYVTPPYLTDIGYSLVESANIASLIMASLSISKILLGKLYDLIGVRAATTVSCIFTIISLTSLIFAKSQLALIILIATAGLGMAFSTVAIPIIARVVFGSRDYTRIYGWLSAMGNIGGILGPLSSGYIFDRTGEYYLNFALTIASTALVTVVYQFLFPKRRKQIA